MSSEGPNDPSAAVEDQTVGTTSWSNYTNVYASDDSDASCSIPKSDASYYIKATGLGFSIPAGATINGIVVEIELAGDGTYVYDNSVKIVKGDSIVGDEKRKYNTLPSSDAYWEYGANNDLWGVAWSDTDINAADFGVVFSAGNANSITTRTAYVDHIRITVYYTLAATGTILDCTSKHWGG